jgi:hypothetical protein
MAIVSRVADTNGSTIDKPAPANSKAAVSQRRAGEAGADNNPRRRIPTLRVFQWGFIRKA